MSNNINSIGHFNTNLGEICGDIIKTILISMTKLLFYSQ